MDMQTTSTTRLASLLLGVDLEDWVQERREQGRSWLSISRELKEATNGDVTLSHEGLRMKYGVTSADATPETPTK
jgi:hypothetical protein